ncbi:hypothetical protein [Staphylococcus caprae]|uniref:hypothetical protein n=2 Tax=Staphylococcus caprae TaxID=29380 RepID=UPI000E6A4930|nr:hypothetical protein [Staphylococcus caprae]RIM32860.1 hypothetical protein BU631_12415 [Staphylococcus caprae]
MSNKYQIDSGDIKSNTEETSAISKISYEIENANKKSLKKNEIRDQVKQLEKNNDFPKNLDYIDSYTDENSGTTTTAFWDKKTNKVILGMTGTILEHDAVRDVGADSRLAFNSITAKDSHYKNTQQFIKKINDKYDIDMITGHSLGGRDAILMGIYYNIPNIVTYNSASLGYRDLRVLKYLYSHGDKDKLKEKDLTNDEIIDKAIKAYTGSITRFNTGFDELVMASNAFGGIEAGNSIHLDDGKRHSMDGFLSKSEQKAIKKELNKAKGYKDATQKAFQRNLKNTKHTVSSLHEMKARMIQQNGGALSSGQEKLIESMTAIAIAQGLKSTLENEMSILKSMYKDMEDLFEKIWKDAEEAGQDEGSLLSHDEVLSALHQGNITENRIVSEPHKKIANKLKKLNSVKQDYDEYISKVNKSIKELVRNDEQLAAQIGAV